MSVSRISTSSSVSETNIPPSFVTLTVMHNRDMVMLNPQDESDDEDFLTGQGEEVFGLNLPERRDGGDDDEEDYEEEEEEAAPAPAKDKSKKAKAKDPLKGRFAKAALSSDDEDEDEDGDSDASSDPDAEGWGRSYYSRPSTRREKEGSDGGDDEKREEERMLEEKEVKRMQRKMREGLKGDDFGLEEIGESSTADVFAVEK